MFFYEYPTLSYHLKAVFCFILRFLLCFSEIPFTIDCDLCFRPFAPRLESHLDIAWKKYTVFSKAGELFLQRLREKL